MIKTYAKCKGCGREYRCVIARDLIHCVYCGKAGTSKIMSNEEKKEPLLTIELQDESSVPKVFYEGKEITGKVRVSFDWLTKDAEPLSGGTKFNVEHHETGHGDIVKKGISLARGKHALDK